MLKYTICFIKRGEKILMLNRVKSPWMGIWNGVGGKLEAGETPMDCIKREIFEETGMKIEKVIEKGEVTWEGNGSGMYTFVAEIPDHTDYNTPKATDEGVLDWKTLDWLTDPDNLGVAAHVKQFLPILIHDENLYEFRCFFNNDGTLDKCQPIPIDAVCV